jgi:SAM-dependent methyltransferase
MLCRRGEGERPVNWKLKSLIQRTVASLPPRWSDALYYRLQRCSGAFRVVDPSSRLRAGKQIADYLCAQGQILGGKHVFEVGTGRRLNIPIALWLCGADRITTVDLNPYLEEELVLSDIDSIASSQTEVGNLFARHAESPQFQQRLQQLTRSKGDFQSILRLLDLRYAAPGDASRVDISDSSVDFHVSYTVFEHIPAPMIRRILLEGKRILRPGGLFVHFIDCSDHFSHSDQSISPINFLQFDERQWNRYAGNRYMYHNRLRMDDHVQLFQQAGLNIVSLDTNIDQRSLAAIDRGFPLDPRFSTKPPEVNATRSVRIIARP